jgi:hypothetical protein
MRMNMPGSVSISSLVRAITHLLFCSFAQEMSNGRTADQAHDPEEM